jgi:cytochrome c
MLVVNHAVNNLVAPKLLSHKAIAIAGAIEDAAVKSVPGATQPAAPMVPLTQLLAKASAEAGQAAAKKCTTCHTFDKGGANRIGPNLWGAVGAKRAFAAGFDYSAGLKAKGGAWGFDDLFAFIGNPKEVVPGTKMAFAGIKSERERADLLAYLRMLAETPAPLPGN